MNLISLLNGVSLAHVTLIPDGNDQPLTSDIDGQLFALLIGDQALVPDAPLLTFVNDDVTFANGGIAQTTGDTATISIEGDNGVVNNFPSGVITSELTAIDVLGDFGNVINAGLIAGDFNGVRFVGDGGALDNTGDIESDSRAVEIIGNDTEIRNAGDIIGTGDQRNGTVYANSTAEDYTLFNTSLGRIDAGFENYGAGVSFEVGDEPGESVDASIVNVGSIVGRGDAAPGENTRGDGIRLFSSVDGGTTYDGDIINRGFVTSDFARGIEIRDNLSFSGSILNSGVIFGATDGLYFGDAPHDAEVENVGIIASDSRAVNIDGSGVELENLGLILGTGDQRNGTVYSDFTADDYRVLNAVTGVIDAGEGNNGAGVVYQVGDFAGDIVEAELVNHGEILGRGMGSGNLAGDGVRLFAGVEGGVTFVGDIVNTGTIGGIDDGIDINGVPTGLSFVGDIENSGTIDAGNDGIVLDSGNSFVGDIKNSGSIVAADDGIELDSDSEFDGDIVNNGEIDAADEGILVDNRVAFTGDIVNSGTIAAGDDGIIVDNDATFSGDIENSGIIEGAEDAIDLDPAVMFNGSILNSGQLIGEDGGIDVSNNGVFIGDIENSGSIFGAEDGIEIDAGVAFHGSILNAETGVITGGVNGIEVNNVLEGPTIENHGTIQSDSRAVNIDGMGTELLNTGTIVGTDDQRDGTVYANSTADDYEIENEGVIDAGEGNNGSGVSLQTGDVDGDVVMASLENAGTIEGRGDATSGNTIGDGVRLFSDVSDAVWQGDIENDGLIMGSEDTDVAVGIRIEDGVTLDGEIVNTGTIVGTEIAIDASDAGGSVEIVNDGEIIGDVVLSAGDDVFDGSGGTVDGVVFGNGGDDVLIGGAFDDILAGGAGDDELTGGSGMDIFVVTPADAPSFDTITDFELGMDLIDATAFASVTVALDEDDTILTFALDNQVRLVDVDLTALVTDDYLV